MEAKTPWETESRRKSSDAVHKNYKHRRPQFTERSRSAFEITKAMHDHHDPNRGHSNASQHGQ
jgi:hypothetical protein